MAQKFDRIQCLVGCMYMAVFCGIGYTMGLIATELRDILELTDEKIMWLTFGSAAGGLFNVDAGIVYDRYGPRICIFLAIVINAVTSTLIYFIFQETIKPSYPVCILIVFIWGHQLAFSDVPVMATVMKNFPQHKGMALSTCKAMLGVALGILNEYYTTVIAPDLNLFFLLLAGPMSLYALLWMAFVKIDHTPHLEHDTPAMNRAITHAMHYCWYWVLGLAMWLAVTDIVRINRPGVNGLDHTMNVVFLCVISVLVFITGPLIMYKFRGDKLLENAAHFAQTEDLDNTPHDPVAALVVTPDAQRSHHRLSVNSADEMRDSTTWVGKKSDAEHFWDMVTTTEFVCCFCIAMSIIGGGLLLMSNLPMIVESYGGGEGKAGIYLSIYSVCSCLGRLLGGRLTEVFDTPLKRVYVYAALPVVMTASLVLTMISSLGNGLYLACALSGLGYGAHYVIGPSVMIDFFGMQGIGKLYSTISFGGLTGDVILSTWLPSYLYQVQIPAHGGNVCYGKHCFHETLIIAITWLGVATILGLWLLKRRIAHHVRTHDENQDDLFTPLVQ